MSIFPKTIQFSSHRKKNEYIQALILVLIPSKGCQFRTRSQELKPRVEHFNKGSLPTLVITHELQQPATSYRETDYLFNNCLHLTGKNLASIASILWLWWTSEKNWEEWKQLNNYQKKGTDELRNHIAEQKFGAFPLAIHCHQCQQLFNIPLVEEFSWWL